MIIDAARVTHVHSQQVGSFMDLTSLGARNDWEVVRLDELYVYKVGGFR